MPLNKEKLQKFEKDLILTLQNKNPLMEVPYYVCLHNPKDEIEVLENFSNLALRIQNKGFLCKKLNLAKMMIDILNNSGLLSDEVLNDEEGMRNSLNKDIRRVLSKDLVKKLKGELEGKNIDHCTILLRYGALWPFIHLSYIFQSIDGSVRSTLVVPYPSELGLGYPLNERSIGMTDYYRAEVVDLR